MDPAELHAKSVIAAALITAHAVEIPRLPTSGEKDDAALRPSCPDRLQCIRPSPVPTAKKPCPMDNVGLSCEESRF